MDLHDNALSIYTFIVKRQKKLLYLVDETAVLVASTAQHSTPPACRVHFFAG